MTKGIMIKLRSISRDTWVSIFFFIFIIIFVLVQFSVSAADDTGNPEKKTDGLHEAMETCKKKADEVIELLKKEGEQPLKAKHLFYFFVVDIALALTITVIKKILGSDD